MNESKIVLTIDDELKNKAEGLVFSLGLNLETAISMFPTKTVNEGGIPFEVKQTKYVESPDFISSHFTIKSAVYYSFYFLIILKRLIKKSSRKKILIT